ncbi:MAG: transcriptional regulator [Deltaproteobacteria bacterium]|nr:transcriptional regulator [Deltaproteobacteria bacterium]
MARIDALWGAPKGSRAGDELEVLATLVAAYESKRWPIDRPDPLVMIEFRLEQLGLERSALTPLFGSASRVSEVFRGKRGLSLAMIRRLHDELGVPAETLLRVPSKRPKTKR